MDPGYRLQYSGQVWRRLKCIAGRQRYMRRGILAGQKFARTHTWGQKNKKSSAALLSQLKRATFLLPFWAMLIYCPYNGPPDCCQSVTDEMCQTPPAPSSSVLRHARSCTNPAALNHAQSPMVERTNEVAGLILPELRRWKDGLLWIILDFCPTAPMMARRKTKNGKARLSVTHYRVTQPLLTDFTLSNITTSHYSSIDTEHFRLAWWWRINTAWVQRTR